MILTQKTSFLIKITNFLKTNNKVKIELLQPISTMMKHEIVKEGVRIDGRGVSDIRALLSDVGIIPTSHGSGLFQRGETQVLNVTTLGTGRMDQMVDGIDPIERKRFMHHYNFPPFSTGETGFMRGPKRREIGHGALAEGTQNALVGRCPTGLDRTS